MDNQKHWVTTNIFLINFIAFDVLYFHLDGLSSQIGWVKFVLTQKLRLRWKVPKTLILANVSKGMRQVAFFHSVPENDPRYDVDKDLINGRLVSLDRDVNALMEDKDEADCVETTGPSPSFEEIIELVI
ncbi:hypothetical protein VNO80_26824 [Phaseolus coccineus]|uniref:Uncharacterized protein n=1 Tax=Phaseolus coccineus TaxID=3886 RepID=A0AAN9LFP4_PHACN